ncbi:MAG TPA: type II secretion system protein [Methylocella sp.]|nr:type II secretion system protein [Methylocella sp.]
MSSEAPTGVKDEESAGFAMIEILAALAVTAISLAAIGMLMASNLRGAGRIEQHITLAQTLRAVETGLPDRNNLSPGTQTGDMQGAGWSLTVAPFQRADMNPRAAKIWTPQSVVLSVQTPSGASLELGTIRLVKISSTP